MIIEVDTKDSRLVKRFLQFPHDLYKTTPQWVPPLSSDVRLSMDRSRHPFYRHSEAAFFLAEDDQHKPIGRLAILNNRNYNQYKNERTAFFYLFECIPDQAAACDLFEYAIRWAHSQGLKKIYGPRGFTALDGKGLLVKGFEHRPAFGIPYNLPYYPGLIESVGFVPVGELLSGYLGEDTIFPEKIHQISKRIQERRGLSIARFHSKRDLKALIPHLKELYNSSLGDLSGNVPLTDEEAKTLADQLLLFADPKLLKIVMKNDQPVGFLFAYPDISAAVQRTKGNIFPIGWLFLLLELRRTKWININGAGMMEGYRGLGGTALLFSEMEKSIREGGFRHADLVQIKVENDRMLRELRNLGVNFYKTHRLYTLEI